MPIADVKSRRTLAGRPVTLSEERTEGDLKNTPNFSYANLRSEDLIDYLNKSKVYLFVA